MRLQRFALTDITSLMAGRRWPDTVFLADYDQGEELRQGKQFGFSFRDGLAMLTRARRALAPVEEGRPDFERPARRSADSLRGSRKSGGFDCGSIRDWWLQGHLANWSVAKMPEPIPRGHAVLTLSVKYDPASIRRVRLS